MTPTAYGNYRPTPPQRPALTQRPTMPVQSGYQPLTNTQMVQGASMAGLRPPLQGQQTPWNFRPWNLRYPGAMQQQQQPTQFNPAQWGRTGPPPLWSRQGGFGQRFQAGGGSDFINQLLAQHAAGGMPSIPGYPPAQTPMQLKQPMLDRFPY